MSFGARYAERGTGFPTSAEKGLLIAFLLVQFLPSLVHAETALVGCGTHRAAFDLDNRARLTSLVTGAGVEFAAPENGSVMSVVLRRTDAFTNRVEVGLAAAKTFRSEKLADGWRFVYSDFGAQPVREMSFTVRGTADSNRLRWRSSATPALGWAVCETLFPRIGFTNAIGGDGADDAVLTGWTFSGSVRRNPGRNGFSVDCRQPGYLGVQMACYYDPRALLLFACEDGHGEAKRLHGWWNGKGNGKGTRLFLQWYRYGWDTVKADLPYDVVTSTIDGSDLTWHDGADRYREWSSRQRWCRTPWKFRTDMPDWLRGKPAYADMGSQWRAWMGTSGALVSWSRDYWHAKFPDATVAVHFDGWERNGVYNMTHYFPLYPTDAAYTAFAEKARRYGFLAFPWPSGTRRSDAFDLRSDGTFAVDERAAFDRDFLPHACLQPNGSRQLCPCGWLRGGKVSYMCPGDPWTVDWFARDVCGELAKRGTLCVSGDQNIGGAAAECWNPSHGHAPGSGRWMTDAARRMGVAAVAALRARFPEAAYCWEEPNEQLNDTVTFNNVREAYRPQSEWSGLFNYLYHEYAPIFPLGGQGRYGQAYQLVNGLMPVVRVERGDIDHDRPILPNGSFEQIESNTGTMGILPVASPRAVALSWSNGPRELPNRLDDSEYHSGRFAMRIECPEGTNRWDHVAVNLAHHDDALAPGRKLRFSAWTKLERGSFWIDFGYFGQKGALGWAKLPASKPGEGWRRVSVETVVPKGEMKMIRLMVNAKRGTLGWLDDVELDEVLPDGSTRTLRYQGSVAKERKLARDLDFYGVRAREWLAYGRRVKPPRLTCDHIDYYGREVEAVCVGAYVSMDGRKAWVLANATDEPRTMSWREDGRDYSVSLAPDEARLVLKMTSP